MNNKGQALVEFILILPVFILILFVIIDFGMIVSTKSSLENQSIDIVGIFKHGRSIEDIKKIYKDVDIDIQKENDYFKVIINSSVDIITPGLNRVLDDPYVVSVERLVYND